MSPVFVVGVDVQAGLHAELDRFDRVRLGSLIVGRRRRAAVAPAQARGEHECVRLIRLRELRIRAGIQQQAHDGDVARLGGPHERRRAFTERAIAARVMPLQERRRQPRIRIGAVASSSLIRSTAVSWPDGLGFGRPWPIARRSMSTAA